VFASILAQRDELREHAVEEEAEPGALAPSRPPHAIQAVVPVAAADEGQSVGPNRRTLVDRAQAVLEQRAPLVGEARQAVGLRGIRCQQLGLKKGHLLGEDGCVPCGADVVRGHEGQPKEVV
jgi:hypothetical protein